MQVKSSRACFIDDANVVAFKVRKDFSKRIMLWPGKGYEHTHIPFNKGCDSLGSLVHVNADIVHFSFEINCVSIYLSCHGKPLLCEKLFSGLLTLEGLPIN